MGLIIINPTLDAVVSATDAEYNSGEAEDAQIGGAGAYRLIVQFPYQVGAWTSARLRFQVLQSQDDEKAPGHAQLCVCPLVSSWPIVETAATSDTPDGSHNWPNDAIVTAQSFDPGMTEYPEPVVAHTWPIYPGGTNNVEFDITGVVRGYPVEHPEFWHFLIYSSEETLAASIQTTQRDVDEQGVQLVLEQQRRNGNRPAGRRPTSNRPTANRPTCRRPGGEMF